MFRRIVSSPMPGSRASMACRRKKRARVRLSRNFFHAIHPDDSPRVQASVARTLETDEDFSEEYRLVQPDGSVRWVVAQGRCERDADGKPMRFPGISFDITDRKNAEALVRASEAEFRTFAQAMLNQVWAATPDGQLDWFNEQAFQYAGLTFDDLAGEKWAAIVHPEDIANAAAAWAAALKSGEKYETEFRLRRADGTYRWHIARAVAIRDEGGAIIRWIGTNTDIDEQKRIGAALQIANETLERRVRRTHRRSGEYPDFLYPFVGMPRYSGAARGRRISIRRNQSCNACAVRADARAGDWPHHQRNHERVHGNRVEGTFDRSAQAWRTASLLAQTGPRHD